MGTLKSNRLQEYAKEFFTTKSEKAFNKLYAEISNVVRGVSSPIFKNDEDKIQDVTNEIAMKVWNGTKSNGDSIFSEDQSFLSWVFVSAKNRSIQYYNQNVKRKEVMESDMIISGKEDDYSGFENAMHESGFSEINAFDDEEDVLFHNNKNKQCEFFLQKLRDLFHGEEYEILYKAIIKQESPEKIAQEYGINSRITVTSRNRRARQKLIESFEEEIKNSKMKENKSIDGKYSKQMNGYKCICNRIGGKLDGNYTEVYDNGINKTIGQYCNGKRSGEWTTFYENGNIESRINYSYHKKPFALYDRFGSIKELGFLVN